MRKQKFKKKIVSDDKVKKYQRGDGMDVSKIKTRIHKKRFENKEKRINWAAEQTAKAEIFLPETQGSLEADEGETTTQFTQRQIVENVDITTAAKNFQLELHDFGPYRANYTRNGRHLLLSGKLGHVAAFDWLTKKLHCEINVMESVHDACWLHLETMFAVAQKNWVYVYDNNGVELHCLKKLNRVLRMEFLPYHFLLATASEEGYLSWLDISIGEIVTQYNTRHGRLTICAQNPYNATICLGHSKGIVTMWSPNVKEPLVKMLCHNVPLSGLAINSTGRYMATSAVDGSLKIWDIRNYNGPVQNYRLRSQPTSLSFSQSDLLAVAMQNIVEIYRNSCTTTAKRAYLRNTLKWNATSVQFCPYEDILGVGTTRGFTSLIVPGAGEPNFDALEANPYQTKTQRREAEVKSLLEKIQPELITLDPMRILEVDVPTLEDKFEEKKKLLFLKAPKINSESKHKRKNKRGNTVKEFKRKKIVLEDKRKKFVEFSKQLKKSLAEQPKSGYKNRKDNVNKKQNVLSRFEKKKTK